MEKEENRFIWIFIMESDLIEGIKNDRKRLRDDIIAGKENGHVGAIFFLRQLAEKKECFLTKNIICKIQELITTEQRFKEGGHILQENFIGNYRKIAVSIVKKYFIANFPDKGFTQSELIRCAPPAEKVPKMMENWLCRAEKWARQAENFSPEENVRKIAHLHFDFEDIHPFADGNGRTGRAIAYYMLKYAGIKPFIFGEYDKNKNYYPCFGDKTKKKIEDYFRIRVFHPENITGRIETIDSEKAVEF